MRVDLAVSGFAFADAAKDLGKKSTSFHFAKTAIRARRAADAIHLRREDVDSDLEKDVPAVEEPEEDPARRDVGERPPDRLPCPRQKRRRAAEEEIRRAAEADDALGEVDRDRVHPDDAEEERPAPPALHVDDEVEEREKRRRAAARDKDERAGPEGLDDRDRQRHQEARADHQRGGDEKDQGLPHA